MILHWYRLALNIHYSDRGQMRKVLFLTITALVLVALTVSVRQPVQVAVLNVQPGSDGQLDDSERTNSDGMTLTIDKVSGSNAPTVTDGRILSDDSSSQQHPLVDNFSAGSLGYIVSYGDWLMMTDAGALRADELQRLEAEFRTLPVNAENQQEMQRYLLGLRYYRALSNRASDSFHQRVERYRTLKKMMLDVDPGTDPARLLDQLFEAEEQDRARQYLHVLQH